VKDVVLSGDVNADLFFVVMPQGGRMTTLTLRVAYPLGFAARAGSGRIDDPNAGWKVAGSGRAIRCTRRGTRKAERVPGQRL